MVKALFISVMEMKPFNIFVDATILGSVGIDKEEIDLEFPCHPFVLGSLFSIVGRVSARTQTENGVSKQIAISETAWKVLNGTWVTLG